MPNTFRSSVVAAVQAGIMPVGLLTKAQIQAIFAAEGVTLTNTQIQPWDNDVSAKTAVGVAKSNALVEVNGLINDRRILRSRTATETTRRYAYDGFDFYGLQAVATKRNFTSFSGHTRFALTDMLLMDDGYTTPTRPTETDQRTGYTAKTVTQLKGEASDRGLAGYSGFTKLQLEDFLLMDDGYTG